MAVELTRLGSWRRNTVVAWVSWETTTNDVLQVIVDNQSWDDITFAVWRITQPQQRRKVTVPVNVTGPTLYAVPNGTRYSPYERLPGDPLATNFGFSYSGL